MSRNDSPSSSGSSSTRSDAELLALARKRLPRYMCDTEGRRAALTALLREVAGGTQAAATPASVAGHFVRRSMFGPWIECKADEPGAVPLYADPRSVETEQTIAADAYFNIAETIGTRSGFSVQEHVETMKEVLEACSEYLHDIAGSEVGGNDAGVALAADVRNCLSGRIDLVAPRGNGDAGSEEQQGEGGAA